MGRLHLFELEDQPWFPSIIRDAGTAYLRLASRVGGHADAVSPMLARLLRRTHRNRIVDLCSGGAGPLPDIVESLKTDGIDVEATLTDLYPNLSAFEVMAVESPQINVHPDPVDALNVPPALVGVRTFFSGFHHFKPDDARSLLTTAVNDREPIAVFEFVARSPVAIIGMLFAPLMVLLSLPFLRPFRWQWIPLTYLIPVIPLFVLWDGVISCLKSYKVEELRRLINDVDAPNYAWEVGQIELPKMPVAGTYLLGRPLD